MKFVVSALAAGCLLASATAAYSQQSDDAKWIAQCIKDNVSEKVSEDVVKKYCACMNEKMDDNETQSITQWEKTHPAERKECDTVSGWK